MELHAPSTSVSGQLIYLQALTNSVRDRPERASASSSSTAFSRSRTFRRSIAPPVQDQEARSPGGETLPPALGGGLTLQVVGMGALAGQDELVGHFAAEDHAQGGGGGRLHGA